MPPAEGLDFPSLQQSWFGFFKRKVFFTYNRCRRCGLLYSPVYFTDEALGQLYGSMPDNTAGLASPHLERTQHGYFSFLREDGALEGDYLEIGPDVGLLTQFAAAESGVEKMWLYEPNRSVHQALRARVQGREFEIREEMRDFSAIPDGSVGVCVMIHVLDHLREIEPLMLELARKLKPGGRLLIVTHDERSLLARILRARWPAYCLQHPLLFNRRSTAKFLEKCGFEQVQTCKSTNHFPLTYLLKHLLFALGLGRIARWNSYSFVMPVRLGNIMTAARRRGEAAHAR